MNTTRQRLTEQAATLQARYNLLMRGRLVPSPKAVAIKQQIDQINDRIADIDRAQANRLALEKAPIEDILEVIAIPLLADVMNDIVAGVDGTLRRAGCQETIYADYVRTIRTAALAMVDTLDHSDAGLPRLLEVDDTLVEAVRKKLMSFIRQRLKLTKT